MSHWVTFPPPYRSPSSTVPLRGATSWPGLRQPLRQISRPELVFGMHRRSLGVDLGVFSCFSPPPPLITLPTDGKDTINASLMMAFCNLYLQLFLLYNLNIVIVCHMDSLFSCACHVSIICLSLADTLWLANLIISSSSAQWCCSAVLAPLIMGLDYSLHASNDKILCTTSLRQLIYTLPILRKLSTILITTFTTYTIAQWKFVFLKWSLSVISLMWDQNISISIFMTWLVCDGHKCKCYTNEYILWSSSNVVWALRTVHFTLFPCTAGEWWSI
jgi:hypothetical protein